jgi:hypothetical protein
MPVKFQTIGIEDMDSSAISISFSSLHLYFLNDFFTDESIWPENQENQNQDI